MDYTEAVWLDAITVVFCCALLVRFGKLSHKHPGTIYIAFHLFAFSSRLWAVSSGATPLFADWGPHFLPVVEPEFVRAIFIADAVLLAMTAGWLLAARRSKKDELPVATPFLNKNLVIAVVAVVLPIGLYGLMTYARLGTAPIVSQLAAESEPTTAYSSFFQVWPGLAFLALIYCFGFRWYLLVPMAAYLIVVGVQGYHRFRLIIPLLLLVQIWLDRHGRRWPSLPIVLLLCLLAAAFFPMKTIGRMVQRGDSALDIAAQSKEIVRDAFEGRAEDHQLLDQFAASLTLIDERGKIYWGQPYLAVVVLPVPRTLWEGKPSVTDYIKDFSRPWRPMKQVGMIVTFIGEAYANFRWAGVAAIPFLLAYLLGRAHNFVLRLPYGATLHFAYLLFACNLIQVFRDGLTSFVFFVFVHMMPLAVIAGVQILFDAYRNARQGSRARFHAAA